MKRKSTKTELIKFRITPLEKEAFQDAADFSGVTLSSWMRERLRYMAIRDLEQAGKKIAFLQVSLEDSNDEK